MSNNKSKTKSKRELQRARGRKRQQQQRLRNMIFIILGGALIIGAMIWPSLQPVEGLLTPEARSHPNADFNVIGDPNAPITIINYSDFQCSFCRAFFAENEQLLIEQFVETGIANYEMRSFGDFLGPESSAAAEAAYCAGDQGAFWEMHDMIFTNYSGGNGGGYAERRLIAMAEDIGLDSEAFSACLDDNKYQDRVNQDLADGQEAGVEGTPSFFINGILLDGNRDVNAFQQVIESILAELE